jgi:acetyl coenzyme A synthetase (ADP forming)-like protein
MAKQIDYFFNPGGVALIGASANPDKLSHGVLLNMTQFGYEGAVYPVNPRGGEILGLKCYPDISEVPDPVELAVIMLPAPVVKPTLEACGKRGLKAVTIISGGFKEVGKEGAYLERECVEVAHRYGMRLIGPNCVGTMDLYSGLNTTFIRGMPARGHIGFISQSGAVCGAVVDHVRDKGIGFSHFVSMGNEADINETDLIEYLVEDDRVHVIAAYLEAIENGQLFIDRALKVSRRKPMVVLKAGRSDAGTRAVSSHTGSLAGSYAAYKAAFKQAGVIEAQTMQELFDIALAFSNQPLPKGNRAAIITNAGGPAALASDSLASYGITLAILQDNTRQKLRAQLNPSAQVDNPVDMLGGATPEEYATALSAVSQDDNVDILLPINVPTALLNPVDIARSFASASKDSEKTILSCLVGDASIGEARSLLHENRVPMYTFPEQLGSVLGAMLSYKTKHALKAESYGMAEDIDMEAARQVMEGFGDQRHLGEAAVRPLLESFHIHVIPAQMANSAKEAAAAANEMGFPVVMKVVSADILHKSDAGAIRLGIKNKQEAVQGYDEILRSAMKYNSKAVIDGVLVEKMAPKGQEVIVGMRRDPQFGPLMMFGLGGIYVELFKDIAFRVAPLSHHDALEMVNETHAGRLLQGFRGMEPADIEAVVDCIIRLGQLSLAFPQIEEIEINPLLVLEANKGAIALDARAILM